MSADENKLKREVEAIRIPDGSRVLLPTGTGFRITQSLGDTFTVMTDMGYMFRIEGKDADAIGKEPVKRPDSHSGQAGEKPPLEQQITSLLKTCYDPEIPVNIVDLGLIYKKEIIALPDGGNKVEIEMTLTAPGCGMGPVLQSEVQSKISQLPDVKEVDVQVVFSPPWSPDRMSDAAKLQLGML